MQPRGCKSRTKVHCDHQTRSKTMILLFKWRLPNRIPSPSFAAFPFIFPLPALHTINPPNIHPNIHLHSVRYIAEPPKSAQRIVLITNNRFVDRLPNKAPYVVPYTSFCSLLSHGDVGREFECAWCAERLFLLGRRLC